MRHLWKPLLVFILLCSLREFSLTFSRLQVIQGGTTPLHSCWVQEHYKGWSAEDVHREKVHREKGTELNSIYLIQQANRQTFSYWSHIGGGASLLSDLAVLLLCERVCHHEVRYRTLAYGSKDGYHILLLGWGCRPGSHCRESRWQKWAHFSWSKWSAVTFEILLVKSTAVSITGQRGIFADQAWCKVSCV